MKTQEVIKLESRFHFASNEKNENENENENERQETKRKIGDLRGLLSMKRQETKRKIGDLRGLLSTRSSSKLKIVDFLTKFSS